MSYNKVFGYYLEVTKPNLHLVPAEYIRKQTIVNGERYFTLELKEHESAEENTLLIKAGRHPVVERCLLDGQPFAPNDAHLSNDELQIMILTGPNLSGKSTYLRQVALIVLLAQIGSFVPAEAAVIGLVDRIFSRVGLEDNISRGQSSFMLEMAETASILHRRRWRRSSSSRS